MQICSNDLYNIDCMNFIAKIAQRSVSTRLVASFATDAWKERDQSA